MAPGTPLDKKEVVEEKALRLSKRGEKKKTDAPIKYFTDSKLESHAMVLKSHSGQRGVGGSNTQAGN